MRTYRGQRGLSALALSRRTEALGHAIKRSVIAEMETGKRTTVTLADILVLAAALEVPPMALILPIGHTNVIEILPNEHIGLTRALDWLDGTDMLGRSFQRPWIQGDQDVRSSEENWRSAVAPLEARNNFKEAFSDWAASMHEKTRTPPESPAFAYVVELERQARGRAREWFNESKRLGLPGSDVVIGLFDDDSAEKMNRIARGDQS
ncbi:helix-turn-helix domain-containing protein [Rathayibacter sp. AY1C4]|uniref:helix-turn-helix domain-containing protein n=1 Tax=Rathayibacter sp. AY1C4 TaxID=2080537 RepID=UPI0011B0A1EC|nr:helix-turn-helix domain-containing protein [Rathayibacter sp. AY1C4]